MSELPAHCKECGQWLATEKDRARDAGLRKMLREARVALEQAQGRYDANEIKWMNIASGHLKRIEQLEAFVRESSCGQRDCCVIPPDSATQWQCNQCAKKWKLLESTGESKS